MTLHTFLGMGRCAGTIAVAPGRTRADAWAALKRQSLFWEGPQ